MTFVATAEIFLSVLRPLIRFRQQQAPRIMIIHLGTDAFQNGVSFRQIFVIGALSFHQIRHCVQTQAIHAHIQPIFHNIQHRFEHGGIIKI